VLDQVFVGQGFRMADQRGFTPLHAQTLKDVIPAYGGAIEWLTTSGFLDVDRSYTPGIKSRGYRWRDDYQTAEQRTASPWLVNRLEERQRRQLRALKPVHRRLYRCLTRTDFDLPSAKAYVEELGVGGEGIRLTPGELIHHKRWTLNVCEYGRVHTPVTRLDKRLRRFLSIGGLGLVGLDVANCQPLLLCLFLRALFKGSTQPFHPPLPPYAAGSLAHNTLTPFVQAGYGSHEEGRNALPADVREYIRLCQEGQFYERLMEESGIAPDGASRGRFKEELFAKVYYGKANDRWAVSKLFRRMFPNVWSAIVHLKRKNFKTFSHDMQRAESGIVINGVCRRLLTEHPTIPLLTIHDSIMTTPAHVETVKAVMLAEFAARGLTPLLRVEPTATHS
jgi:hypothetical protein